MQIEEFYLVIKVFTKSENLAFRPHYLLVAKFTRVSNQFVNSSVPSFLRCHANIKLHWVKIIKDNTNIASLLKCIY